MNAGARPRVLVVGHGAAATGFSRVADALIDGLRGVYDFCQFATNHRTERVEGGWPVYGNPDPLDVHGLERLAQLIDRLRPQIVLVLHDLWFCSIHARRLASIPNGPSTVAYCPVDGVLTRPTLYSCLSLFDRLVAYNAFGEAELKKIQSEEAMSAPTRCSGDRIEVIPHGIDLERFYPLSPHDLLDRRAAKRELLGDGAGEAGFLVLSAAKHDARKRLDLTIAGFARFAREKPREVKLYLHTATSREGVDLLQLAHRAGIADRVLTTAGPPEDDPAVDEHTLNLIYNACDVGLSTSSGEGWGLVSCEHAATGAAQVVPAHTGCEQLWNTTATTLPVRDQAEHIGLGMLRQFVAEEDVASVLHRLYADVHFRAEQGRRSHHLAQQDAYCWPRVAERWDALFQGLLASRGHFAPALPG
ncbi:MAG TPA: glycosyltransferase [Solirubrobacteraceae bacterium]|nr:glycosyltransferase [Solirubrobacteraceae bacterium]